MTFHGMTKIGELYMAKCLANNSPISFAKVKIGNGLLTEYDKPYDFSDIKSIKKEVSITDIKQVETAAQLLMVVTNEGVETGFYCSEVGIYINDEGVEKLYWYINDANQSPWLGPEVDGPVKYRWWENILVTTQEVVIVNWTGKELWIDQQYMNDHTASKEEIDSIFDEEFIYDTLMLATESQIRNLFPDNKKLTGEAQFDLSSLTDDEASIVNMKLLSLFNDLLQQRMNHENEALTNEISNLDKNLKSIISQLSSSLSNDISTKANKNIQINAGEGLEGGGTLEQNRTIQHKNLPGYKHIPTGGKNGQYLKYSSNGTATWANIEAVELDLEATTTSEIDTITFEE
ncbi:MAG: hypothetical protein SOV59_03650 [Fusobacterium mortiferum]|mgnify:FL=1|nr:hypothetical protein [Fusobacterium mortiferum]